MQFERTMKPITSSNLAEQLLHEYIDAFQIRYTAGLNACSRRNAALKVVFVPIAFASAPQAKTTCQKTGPDVIVRKRHTTI